MGTVIRFLARLFATPQPKAPAKADKLRTPGVTNPLVTQDNIKETIGKPGWAGKQRPSVFYTNTLKWHQMKAWGLPGSPADYEEDHLIPLELGGDPHDPMNLWPQRRKPAPGAGEKDKVENQLHTYVMSGQLTLAAAQAMIVATWTA